jgi:TRAP-type uncharacterized transport system substrate-binding protein
MRLTRKDFAFSDDLKSKIEMYEKSDNKAECHDNLMDAIFARVACQNPEFWMLSVKRRYNIVKFFVL